MIKIKERFWRKVHKTSTCWLWTGARGNNGYGALGYAGKSFKAHRISWMFFTGEMPPPNLDVCHTCDNPPCVNPGHLFLGTRKDNMQDMKKKGRSWHTLKTHCPQGHAYVPANMYKYSYARVCKICVLTRSGYGPESRN